MFENRIIHGDNVTGMRGLPDAFVHLTVTSPPYDDLRTYAGHSRWDFAGVARELHRITAPGGTVVWVVQEQIVNGSETGESSRQRLAFLDLGFRLHHTMVMGKSGGHQHSSNRYGRPLEYAFVLSKGAPRYFCPLRDKPNKEKGRMKVFTNRLPDGSFPRSRRRKTNPFGIRPAVWTYATGRNVTTKDGYALAAHPALMPERMAQDHIRSWSKVGDLVFDPFAGVGTTLKMARLNFRHYLGFEANPEYVEVATRRLAEADARIREAARSRMQGRRSDSAAGQPHRDARVGDRATVDAAPLSRSRPA